MRLTSPEGPDTLAGGDIPHYADSGDTETSLMNGTHLLQFHGRLFDK